jgi:hypothetical protein
MLGGIIPIKLLDKRQPVGATFLVMNLAESGGNKSKMGFGLPTRIIVP